jgi:tetratricopeptide (TPR) repeat protein
VTAPRSAPPPTPAGPWPLTVLDALAARPRLAVGLAAVLPVLLTLWNQPILDDGWAALDNPLTYGLGNLGRIFRELYGFAGEPSVRGPYRPITTLSYALNYAVHGRWPPGYHLVNVALHAGASLLVLALARRLAVAALPVGAARVAVLAGLLFALHPAHVEAVATIFGRTEPLSTCFALSALLLALGRREARWRLPAALALLVAGVLSKEVAIVTPGLFAVVALTLPAAAGLATRPGLGRGAPRQALVEVGLVSVLLLTAFVPYLLGRGPALAVAPEARWFPVGTPGAHVALTMSRVLGEYLRILAFPTFLGGDFAYAARLPTLTAPTPGFWLATVAWVATAAAALLLRRRAPLVAAGLAWIFLPLLPVLQLIPVGVLLAERLLYLPSVGLCLAAAGALGSWLAAASAAPPAAGRAGARPGGPPRPKRAGGAASMVGWGAAARVAGAALLLLSLLLARTVVRTLDWRTCAGFWTSELAKAPNEVVVNSNLGEAWMREGNYPAAIERFRAALRIHPRYWRAQINLGIALGAQQQPGEARRAFEQALTLAPESSDPPFYFARWLRQVGEREEALRLLEAARRLRPEEARSPLLQGEILLELGRRPEALAALTRAAALDPKDPKVRALLRLAAAATSP